MNTYSLYKHIQNKHSHFTECQWAIHVLSFKTS